MNMIPESINRFNMYLKGNRLIGVSGEISLPDLSSMTNTVSGAGIAGEMESASIGMFGSIKQELPFRMLSKDMLKLYNPMEPMELTLRASEQSTVQGSGIIDFQGMRVVFRGRPVDIKLGTLKQGGQMDSSVTLELSYLLIEVDGETMFELDKLNDVFVVNGVDLLAKVRKQC